MENIWFLLDYLSLNEWISLKFMWYISVNKIQVEFKIEFMHQFGQELWPLIYLKSEKKNQGLLNNKFKLMDFFAIYMVHDHCRLSLKRDIMHEIWQDLSWLMGPVLALSCVTHRFCRGRGGGYVVNLLTAIFSFIYFQVLAWAWLSKPKANVFIPKNQPLPKYLWKKIQKRPVK